MLRPWTIVLPLLSCFVASCAATAPASATASASAIASELRIDGDVSELTLSIDDLRALGTTAVAWSHGGASRDYESVALEAVLRRAGVDPGAMGSGVAPSDKRPAWKFAVGATASDGFQATFSVAEVFRGMGRTEAFVALAEDGRPLGDEVGPLRLIVPTDGEASRSVRNLRRLAILDLRRQVPAR